MFKRGSHARRGRHGSFGIKAFLLSLAVSLMVFCIIGGTLAWLTTETTPIKNVFTYGNIQIELEETTGDEYKMAPGKVLAKDPKVTVKAGSENCWLFVKIDESVVKIDETKSAKLSEYITYSVAEGWTALDGVDGVYYREVNTSDTDEVISVLMDDKVTSKESVTQEMISVLTEGNYPTLTFTAYAVQRDADIEAIDSAAKAWALVNN